MAGVIASSFVVLAHPSPANHFVEHVQSFREKEVPFVVVTTHFASRVFREAGLDHVEAEGLEEILERIRGASQVIVDVGTLLSKEVLETLPKGVEKIAYYDNPESNVPGGYFETAVQVMACADTILFASRTLPEKIDGWPEVLHAKKRIGIGYYPMGQGAALRAVRTDLSAREAKRNAFFEKYGKEDTGQKIVVYFGGNNEAYFRAFEYVCRMIREWEPSSDEFLFVLQQHPRAKDEGRDRGFIDERWVVSEWNSMEMAALADMGLYQQTSMNYLLLGGLPLIQATDCRFDDGGVLGGLIPVATDVEALRSALRDGRGVREDAVARLVGFAPDWKEALSRVFTAE